MNNNEEDINEPLSHGLPSEAHLKAIGKVVVNFSKFEQNVATLMALCYGCEPEVIANVAYALDMRKRCELLKGILAYRLGSRDKSDMGQDLKRDKDMKNIVRLFKRVAEATTRRNIIAHSHWLIGNDTGDSYMVKPKGQQPSGFPDGDIVKKRPRELDNDADFISKIDDDLWEFFWDNLGDWIQQRADEGNSGIFHVQISEDEFENEEE